jgi:hypothetical protein
MDSVIASEAKQSILQQKESVDCFVAIAPRNDGKECDGETAQYFPALPRCRRLSSTAEFGEDGFDLAVAGEAAFGRRPQATIDAGKFVRRRFVLTPFEPGIKFKGEVGNLVLDLGRPCLDAFLDFGRLLCLHDG